MVDIVRPGSAMETDLEALEWVRESGEISMRGPYLVERVRCPVCGQENTLRLLEGRASPVSGVLICLHLRYRELRDDGGYYGFSRPAEVAAG